VISERNRDVTTITRKSLLLRWRSGTIKTMKDRDASRHPGPFRIMQVDSEIAGLLVAVGFLVMGFVSMPIATWFVLGALTLGVVVALLLRFTPKKFSRVVLGTVIILAVGVLCWLGHEPRRPGTVSSNAFYVLPNNVPFTMHKTGYWLDCWFDQHAKVDRCKLTDENGNGTFEDVFLPCVGQTPLKQWELVFDTRWTAYTWTRSPDKGINVPVVYLKDRQVLLPQSFYAEAKRDAGCSPS
jgi:hypothetical protein